MNIMGESTVDEKIERIALAALRKIRRIGKQGTGASYERTEEGEIAHVALTRIKQAQERA